MSRALKFSRLTYQLSTSDISKEGTESYFLFKFLTSLSCRVSYEIPGLVFIHTVTIIKGESVLNTKQKSWSPETPKAKPKSPD